MTSQRQKPTRISIAAAVALIGLYMVYDKVARPPRNIRHIPSVSFLAYVKEFLQDKSIDEIAQKISLPMLAQSETGIYTRFDLFGWNVTIANPEAAKKYLLKTGKERVLQQSQSAGYSCRKYLDLFVVNPAFHRAMPVHLFGRLSAKVLDVIDKQLEVNGGAPVDFNDMTQRFALDVIGLAGFGFEFHAIEEPENEWVVCYDRFVTESRKPFFIVFPFLDRPPFVRLFPSRVRAHQELTKLLEKIDTVIAAKRQMIRDTQDEREKDLLTLMIEAGEKGDGILSDEELKASAPNLCIFFIAGHETTASALAYAVGFLARYPEIQEKARKEVLGVLGDAPEHVLPTLEQVRSMPYIDMILKETMRMNSPASSVFPRIATEDTELNGVFIPKGTYVTLQIHELHHNPAVWKNPEEFNPERFAAGGEADQLASQGIAWSPFSNGSRQCIGMNFSLDEQRTLLPMLLRKYELSLPEDSIHRHKIITTGIGLVKPKDMPIVFKRRY
ncbi:cytochrome P450 [Dichotomocladium elegans]|nr:cytochrome P450 [Dichotomocladium elegans]